MQKRCVFLALGTEFLRFIKLISGLKFQAKETLQNVLWRCINLPNNGLTLSVVTWTDANGLPFLSSLITSTVSNM
jgi:hypothetical protein